MYQNIDTIYMSSEHQPIQSSDTVQDILNKMCSSTTNEITFHYAIFKAIANAATYGVILNHIYKTTQTALTFYPTLIIHANLKSITIGNIDTHKQFILDVINKMSVEFPDTLDTCYLYKTPFVFSQIYNMLSIAIDKETKQKIQIIKQSD